MDREANVLVTQTACEELSALADTVLAGHRHCLASHAHLSMIQCTVMRFSCPEAAAAIRVAAWLGIGTFSFETGWASAARPSSRLLHRELHWELDQMPQWCRRLYVQVRLRAWLVDAVREFRDAASKGRPCEWEPLSRLQPAWFFKDGTFSLNKVPSLAELEGLASAGHQPALASIS